MATSSRSSSSASAARTRPSTLAERLAAAIRRPIVLEGRPLVVGVSIGIALGRGRNTVAGDLLAHADAAMYAAKEQGKGRHVVFDPSMQHRAQSRLEMETELRAAIEAESFEVHYQPILELPSQEIVGFEALVRWRDPVRGLVLPGEFIPLAEATGMIVPLGRLVTRTACRQLRAWRDAGIGRPDLTISVNASARQVVEPGFATEVRDHPARDRPRAVGPRARDHRVPDDARDRDRRRRAAAAPRAGRPARDRRLRDRVQRPRVLQAVRGPRPQDRPLVRRGLGASREDTAIVTATLSFAAALGLVVTAEGVEMAHQLERLEALGCHRAQGFLFSPAIPASEVPAAVRPVRAAVDGAGGGRPGRLRVRDDPKPVTLPAR